MGDLYLGLRLPGRGPRALSRPAASDEAGPAVDPAADPAADPLDEIVGSVGRSKRYRHVCEATVRRLGARALESAGGNVRDAAKRTKRELHQIFGAFVPAPPRYARLLEALRRACAARDERGDETALREALQGAMRRHASTRERLAIVERFHAELFARCGAPATVLDLACGLNPLAVPWMGLPADCRYLGVEIDRALVAFVRDVLDLLGVEHRIEVADLLLEPPLPAADIALLLKLVPTLEQQERGSAARLLDAVPAPRLAVSFPTRSLGRRAKGMAGTYARFFDDLLAQRPWHHETFELPGELVYVVRKESA